MQRVLNKAAEFVLSNNNWIKLASPTVGRGLTACPKRTIDQQNIGVRYDYDGEIEIDGTIHHKYELQANAGDSIPSTIKSWRGANGGTHAVMANVYVKKDGTKEDVADALTVAHKSVQGS